MKSRLTYFIVSSIILLFSCDEGARQHNRAYANPGSSKEKNEPNFDYTVISPAGWAVHDTTIQNLKIRFIVAPTSMPDRPIVNILISSMEGSEIDDFTRRNMYYLVNHAPGINLLDKGKFSTVTIKGRWFTYTREQDGLVRDMINYIIPVRGFAYMITCGTNKGSMTKYRPVFDKIAESFSE